MTIRRHEPLPGARLRSAQKVTFDGSLGGRVRSARPTRRDSDPSSPSTFSSGGAGAGQIYRATDGNTDVAIGDYLLDLAGVIWYKDPNTNGWVSLYSGVESGDSPRHGPLTYRTPNYSQVDFSLHLGGSNTPPAYLKNPSGGSGYTPRRAFGVGFHNEWAISDYVLGEFNFSAGYSYIVGRSNYVEEGSASILGYANSVNTLGQIRLVLGSGNTINDANTAALVGADNTLTNTHNSTVFGNNNEIDGAHHSHALGAANTIAGAGTTGGYPYSEPSPSLGGESLAVGRNNSVEGYQSQALGSSNLIVSADNALALGVSNNISADNTFALGSSNIVSGAGSLAIGRTNTVSGVGSIVIGNSSQATGVNSMTLGIRATVIGSNSWVLGNNAFSGPGWTPPGWAAPMVSSPLIENDSGALVAKTVEIRRSPYSTDSPSGPVSYMDTYLKLNTTDGNAIEIGVVGFPGREYLTVRGERMPIIESFVPTTTIDAGADGTIAYDSTHLYVCVSDDNWRRVALSTW